MGATLVPPVLEEEQEEVEVQSGDVASLFLRLLVK